MIKEDKNVDNNEWKIMTNNNKLSAADILGVDVNQSLHHLVGYVWAEGNQKRVFPSETFCALIQFICDQHREVVDTEKKKLRKAAEVLEYASESLNGYARYGQIGLSDIKDKLDETLKDIKE